MTRIVYKLVILSVLNILCAANVYGREGMINYKLQVAARALVVKESKLLLVSNDGELWYTPGGRLNANETLLECVVREVKEETGINVKANEVVSVYDFFDKEDGVHKVEVYFSTQIKSNVIPENWQDKDGPVKFVKFFSQQDLKNMNNIAPAFLKDAAWLKDNIEKIYEGYEVK